MSTPGIRLAKSAVLILVAITFIVLLINLRQAQLQRQEIVKAAVGCHCGIGTKRCIAPDGADGCCRDGVMICGVVKVQPVAQVKPRCILWCS